MSCVRLQFRDEAINPSRLAARMGSYLLVSWSAAGQPATGSMEAWIEVPSFGNGLLCGLGRCAAQTLKASSADAACTATTALCQYLP